MRLSGCTSSLSESKQCRRNQRVLAHLYSRFQSIAESTQGLRGWFNRAITRKRAEIDEHVAHNDGTVDMDQIRNDVFTRLNLINYIDKKVNFTDGEIVRYVTPIWICRLLTGASLDWEYVGRLLCRTRDYSWYSRCHVLPSRGQPQRTKCSVQRSQRGHGQVRNGSVTC
jgi:hypothetical protein